MLSEICRKPQAASKPSNTARLPQSSYATQGQHSIDTTEEHLDNSLTAHNSPTDNTKEHWSFEEDMILIGLWNKGVPDEVLALKLREALGKSHKLYSERAISWRLYLFRSGKSDDEDPKKRSAFTQEDDQILWEALENQRPWKEYSSRLSQQFSVQNRYSRRFQLMGRLINE